MKNENKHPHPMSNKSLTREFIHEVCKIGQRADCCRYLTCGPNGFYCEKHTSLGRELDAKAKAGTMVALSDNCEGVLK